RRKEIENSLISKDGNAEKMKDMLSMMIMSNTSLIVDNLTDDLSPELKQSMTEREILGNVLDSVFGGTSTHYLITSNLLNLDNKYVYSYCSYVNEISECSESISSRT
ncbi:14676_t:CDS:2, partial [Gigaspora margarita]